MHLYLYKILFIGLLKLPSQRTLQDYTHYAKAAAGFSASVDRQLMEAGQVSSCEEAKKYLVLLIDEMHIKEDLVYNKATGIEQYNMCVCVHA